jgi:hypothetical protein
MSISARFKHLPKGVRVTNPGLTMLDLDLVIDGLVTMDVHWIKGAEPDRRRRLHQLIRRLSKHRTRLKSRR